MRVFVALSILLLLISGVAGQTSGDGYAYEDGFDNMFVDFDQFEFDSQWEILTELVAPFLFLFIIFQIGLERALNFTTSTDDSFYSDDAQKKKNKKYSIVLALITTLLLVPTQHFQEITALTAIIFGSLVYILLLLFFFGFFYMLMKDAGAPQGGP